MTRTEPYAVIGYIYNYSIRRYATIHFAIMKKTLTALLFTTAVVTSVAQTVPDTETDGIKNYFTTMIGGGTGEYHAGTKVSTSDIAAMQESVWGIWKQANDEFDEEKLPNKQYLLSADFRKKWNLPSELEPNAVMPITMGYKGNTDNPLPTFIFLHGSAEKNSEWASMKSIAAQNNDAPSFYFIPQIPNSEMIGGVTYYRWYQKAKQWAWEKLIRQMNLRDNQYDINKLYFIGISEGAYGSQRLGSFYADYLAGIGPMAGGEPIPNCPIENLRNTAVHFRTGGGDNAYYRATLTTKFSEKIDALQEQYPDGYDHDVALYPGLDHGMMGNYGAATPWLKNKTRNPWPKHVSWEDYEMDGNWRKGFHNIQILRRDYGNTAVSYDRMFYEMDIEDNNIDMRVRKVNYNITEVGYANLVLDFNRTYSTNVTGMYRVYLNNELVDLSREVTLTVNGVKVFQGVLQPTLDNMVNSCALFFDHKRVFPASIDVNLDNMTASAEEVAGVDDVFSDETDNAPVEYYNLQGVKVTDPQPGMYIRRQGARANKVIIK